MEKSFLQALAVGFSNNTEQQYELYKEKIGGILSLKEFSETLKTLATTINNANNLKDNIENNLINLRNQLKDYKIDGFIFSTTDEYINEYVPLYAQRMKFFTGFNPSLGLCIVLDKKAAIFVDGRYTLQAKQELDPNLFEIHNYSLSDISSWLYNNCDKEFKLGINLATVSNMELKAYEKICKDINLQIHYLKEHLIDKIWKKQPPLPISVATPYLEKYSGKNSSVKITEISANLQQNNINNFIVTATDNIAWLLNIRGNDVQCNPLLLSKLIITDKEDVYWFVNQLKLPNTVIENLPNNITLFEEDYITSFIQEYTQKNKSQNLNWAVASTSPAIYKNFLTTLDVSIKEIIDPIYKAKCIKNEIEIAGIKQAHIEDGIAITKLLYKIHNQPEAWNEITIDEELHNLRSKSSLYTGTPSFPSIIGYNSNGAIVHYKATLSSNKALKNNGYLLIDCGGQYYSGTTDITRAISFESPSNDYKIAFTAVLKGHIHLANCKFKKGTKGNALDILARYHLWQQELDFSHGTGHGIGCYLCVHEGPINISPKGGLELEQGMVISNEPGFYKEGEYGIRLENVYIVQPVTNSDFLYLDVATLVPFDCKNIKEDLLTPKEKAWLNTYHKKIIDIIGPNLNKNEQIWLQNYIKYV